MRRPTSVSRAGASIAPSRREQLARRAPRRGGRRLQPGERIGVAHAQRRQRQRHLGQIGAGDLGLIVRAAAARSRGGCRGAARVPGACVPARPARCVAARLADLRRAPASAGRSTGECAAIRARPESITPTTPSIVTDDSATFVDRMILRRLAGAHGARLLLERHLAVQRQHREVARSRQLGERRLRAPDLAGARAGTPAGRRPCPRAAGGGRRRATWPPAAGRRAWAGARSRPRTCGPRCASARAPPRKSRDRIGVERRRHRDARPGRGGRSRAGGAARRARDRSRRAARGARRARRRRRPGGAGAASSRRTNSPSVMNARACAGPTASSKRTA